MAFPQLDCRAKAKGSALCWNLWTLGYRKGKTKITALNKCCGVTRNLVKYKESLTERCLAYVFSWRTLSLTSPVPTKVNSG